MNFISQSTTNRHSLVCAWGPITGALELIGPESKANIVGRGDSDGPSEYGKIHGLSIIATYGRIEPIPQREVPVCRRPTEPDRLHEKVGDIETSCANAPPETACRVERRANTGVGKGRRNVGAVFRAEDFPIRYPHQNRDDGIYIDIDR